MNFVDVGPLQRRLAVLARSFQTLDVRIIDPFAVERDGGVGEGAVVAAGDEPLLAAVGVQQHEVGARFHEGGVGDLRPQARLVVALPRRADVDDVVVVLDGRILGDGPRVDVDRVDEEWFLVLGGCGRGDEPEDGDGQEDEKRSAECHGGVSAGGGVGCGGLYGRDGPGEWYANCTSTERPCRLCGAAMKNTRLAEYQAKAGTRPAAPKEIALTHPDKMLFPDAGVTKGDVFDYYRRVAQRLLPHLRDRPMTLERLPDGVGPGKPHFWQKHTPPSYPDWVPRVELPGGDGRTVAYLLINDPETLLYLVNQGALTFHPWLSRVGDLDRPDFVLFDLDPGEADFTDAVAVARGLHTLLREEETEPVVKTSGKSGLHVLTAWRSDGGFEEARAWARGVAERLTAALPEQATLEIRKAKRGRRVYVDVLQNARGKHVVPPYVLRATPTATASAPLRWAELTPDLDPKRFDVWTMPARLGRMKRDPAAALQPVGP